MTHPPPCFDKYSRNNENVKNMALTRNTNKVLALTRQVLKHMLHTAGGVQHGGMLLAGDPGIGKTTAVNILGKLLDVNVITIEVPHIVEEHLINIPFIVFNPATNATTGGTTSGRIGEDDYKLVLADSHLFQQMQQSRHTTDDQYLEYIKTAPPVVQSLYAALGGTATAIPADIKNVRSKIGNILFLDEFYRQTSTRIRNILRSILNGNIGMHRIPSSTYIVYASNMADEGLDEVPHNHQFLLKNFSPPSRDEWFTWLAGQYSKNANIRLDPRIINKMQQCLTDADISYQDVATSVRTSPRRWEQVILFINGTLPVSSKQEASVLITNIRNQFINHATEEHSDLADKVVEAVTELISDTSNIQISPKELLEPHEWRLALDQAIQQLKKGGEFKRHIPVISGPPGIGKTKYVNDVAADNGMLLIDIDVSELFPDDVTGNPLPAGQTGDTQIRVKFSLPKLYYMITKRIAEKDAAYKEFLKAEHPDEADEKISEYQKKRWKYIIFFDELNRCDQRTFNALRRVMLEKSFGPDANGKELKLPSTAIVIGAWNPDPATGGTSEVTQHFADVVDVIPARASWTQTKRFLSKRKFPELDDAAQDVVLSLLDEFANKFKIRADEVDGRRISDEQRPFMLDFNGKPVYFSPREYTDVQSSLARAIALYSEDVWDEPDASTSEKRELLDDYLGEALDEAVGFPLTKHGIPPHSVLEPVKEWLRNIPDNLFGGLLTRKVHASVALSSALSHYLDGRGVDEMVKDPHFINNHNNKSNAEIIDDLNDLLRERLVDDESITKYLLDDNHKAIARSGDDLVYTTEPASLLRNFVMAMLYTLSINEYDNLRIQTAGKALSQAASKIRADMAASSNISEPVRKKLSRAVMILRSEIQDYIEGDE